MLLDLEAKYIIRKLCEIYLKWWFSVLSFVMLEITKNPFRKRSTVFLVFWYGWFWIIYDWPIVSDYCNIVTEISFHEPFLCFADESTNRQLCMRYGFAGHRMFDLIILSRRFTMDQWAKWIFLTCFPFFVPSLVSALLL